MPKPRQPDETLPPCFALVFAGLESVAQLEIQEDLRGEVKKTGPGIVVFRVPVLEANLLQLRTVEDVFLFAWGTDKLTYRAQDLEQIEDWTAREVDWKGLLRWHHKLRPKPSGKPSYRLVTQMEGEHGYRRTDARAALARGLAGVFPASWRPAEEKASVEIWLTIRGATAVCGVRLSDRRMRHRTYKEAHQRASLRPSIAAAMARLADLRPDLTVVDPMCGAGTILAESLELAKAKRLRTVNFLGGDIEPEAVRSASANLRSLGKVALERWDARRLPLADQAVDRIISNPPFGKQLESPETVGRLYAECLKECDRVLRPKGRSVFLVSDQISLESAAPPTWKLIQKLRVRVLGLRAFLSVWQKPGTGARQP